MRNPRQFHSHSGIVRYAKGGRTTTPDLEIGTEGAKDTIPSGTAGAVPGVGATGEEVKRFLTVPGYANQRMMDFMKKSIENKSRGGRTK